MLCNVAKFFSISPGLPPPWESRFPPLFSRLPYPSRPLFSWPPAPLSPSTHTGNLDFFVNFEHCSGLSPQQYVTCRSAYQDLRGTPLSFAIVALHVQLIWLILADQLQVFFHQNVFFSAPVPVSDIFKGLAPTSCVAMETTFLLIAFPPPLTFKAQALKIIFL